MKLRHKIMIILALLIGQFAGHSAVYFHYHDSPYAEACPEQKTLLWCDSKGIKSEEPE